MTTNCKSDGSSSVRISRQFVRSGLFGEITNSEASLLLQVIWNGPLVPSRAFGMPRSTVKRCLGRLRNRGLIQRTSDGYVCALDFKVSMDFLWIEPLRYGWITLPARLLLIFLSEWCDGRIHCFHGKMAEAMRTTLGIRRRRYDELFGELLRHNLVRKSTGRLDSIAYAPLQTRQALREHPGYIRAPRIRLDPISEDVLGGAESAYDGSQEVRTTGSGIAFDGIKECVQGSASGLPLRDFSWAHSPPEEGGRGELRAERSTPPSTNLDKTTETHPKNPASAPSADRENNPRSQLPLDGDVPQKEHERPSRVPQSQLAKVQRFPGNSDGSVTTREEYFLKVYLESRAIHRKYTPAVIKAADAHGLRSTVECLTLSQWFLCLYILRRNETISFKAFFDGGEPETLARRAIELTEMNPAIDPSDLREWLEAAIEENPTAPGAEDPGAVFRDLDFERSRPHPLHVETWVQASLLRPTESIFCQRTRKFIDFPCPDWRPRSVEDVREYGRKHRHVELVERVLTACLAVTSAPGYAERIEAALDQRREVEARNDAIVRERIEQQERDQERQLVEPPPPPAALMRAENLRRRIAASKEAARGLRGPIPPSI